MADMDAQFPGEDVEDVVIGSEEVPSTAGLEGEGHNAAANEGEAHDQFQSLDNPTDGSVNPDLDTVPESEFHNFGVIVNNPAIPDESSAADSIGFDVIGVHGLHGHRLLSWQSHEDGVDRSWLANAFTNATSKPGRVILYGYDSNEESGDCYTLRGVYREAEALLEHLVKLRPPDIKNTRRPIYFVSHDVGGLIVKAALVLASYNEPKYGDILHSTRATIFLGYPHRPLTGADLEEQIFRLLSLRKDNYQQGHMARLVKTLAETIAEINDAFIHTNMLTQAMMVNIFSTHDDPAQRVFDRFTALMGSPSEYRLPCDKPHLELTDGDESGSHFLKSSPDEDWLQGNFDARSVETLRKVLNQTSPIYPSLEGKAVVNNPELEGLTKTDTNRILHIQCPSDAGLVSERVRNYLDGSRTGFQMLFYFRFKAHDIRFNTMKSMLWASYSQVAFNRFHNIGSWIQSSVGTPKERQGWTTEDLYAHWEYFRSSNSIATSLYVLGCLDECDDSALWFLAQLHRYITRTESYLKIVIVTTKGTPGDKLITEALDKFPSELTARIDYTLPSPVPVQVGFEVSMLLQEDSRYVANGLEDDVKTLISGCANDEKLCRLLINWLKSNRDPLASVPRLLAQSKSPSPALIFDAILAEIPDERRPWAQKLLSWMLSSFRSLRTFEFCYVSELCLNATERTSARVFRGNSSMRRHLADVLKYFGGMITVVHDEIRFSHHNIRYWLESGQPEHNGDRSVEVWYRQKTEHDRQVDIVQACLEYLREENDSAESWAAKLPYAIQFCTAHYKQAGLTDGVLETIFEHQPTLQRWVESYILLPAPFTKPLRAYETPLPIAAHFGLEDIIKSLLQGTCDIEVRGQALVEAARAAQLPALRLIIKSYPTGLNFDDTYLHDAVGAASCCGNHELFRELVDLIPKLPHDSVQQKPKEEDQKEAADGAKALTNSLGRDGSEEETSQGGESTQPASEDPFMWLKNVLFRASGQGLADIVATLLSLGVDPNPYGDPPRKAQTPLHLASRFSRLEVVKLLVAAGASLTAVTEDLEAMPLHTASSYGAYEVVKFLLEKGAPVDAKDTDGWMPLQDTCEWGHYAAADAILQHRKFQEYMPSVIPDQPLVLAAQKGRYKVVEALLRHGADPNTSDTSNKTPLWQAVSGKRIDICRLLLENKADPDFAPGDAMTPLIQAIKEESLEMVKLLIEKGADIEKKEPQGDNSWQRTPLHIAVAWDQPEIVRYLISKNADIHVKDSDDWTPIWAAARHDRTEIVRILCEAGADANSVCTDMLWTPMHPAYDFPETIRILLEHGADINRESVEAYTPFDYTINKNQPETLRVMLSASKNKPNLTSSSTQDVLRGALSEGWAEIIALVLEAGMDVNILDEDKQSLLSLAVPLSHESMVRVILEYHPDLYIKDINENTALHHISVNTPVASVRLVVNAGGPLDIVNKFKQTPLIQAIFVGNDEVVRYLLTKESIITTLSIPPVESTGTALHYACLEGSPETVQLLIDNGSDVDLGCPGKYGTPLMSATVRAFADKDGEREQIIRLLFEKGANPFNSAGMLGYPIISASLACPANIVQLFLDRKVPTDVEDSCGRKPIHLACYNSLEVLNLLDVPDSEFAARDLVGRVPLHYAVLSGQVDLVEEVLTRSERVGIDIEVQDKDSWTPLLWAARASRVWTWENRRTPAHDEVVSFLLKKGADTKKVGDGIRKSWVALDIAYYHNADSIVSLIEAHDPAAKEAFKPTKRGRLAEGSFCDCCYMEPSGLYFECKTCHEYVICFKCFRFKEEVHPQHEFNDFYNDWDYDDPVSKPESEPAKSVNGDVASVEEDQGDQFDDEIVGDDMTEAGS